MGTKGWHARGYLPHYDGWDINQHVVFRLHDSVPPGAHSGDDVLDRCHGSSLLGRHYCAGVVSEALLHGHGERYQLHAWCIMPNHVHALLLTPADHELGGIVRLWKAYSAARINAIVGRRGRLWAADYFDRYMRDDAHFESTKHYIEMNPVKAGLCAAAADWPFSSAGWTRDL